MMSKNPQCWFFSVKHLEREKELYSLRNDFIHIAVITACSFIERLHRLRIVPVSFKLSSTNAACVLLTHSIALLVALGD